MDLMVIKPKEKLLQSDGKIIYVVFLPKEKVKRRDKNK